MTTYNSHNARMEQRNARYWAANAKAHIDVARTNNPDMRRLHREMAIEAQGYAATSARNARVILGIE